MTACSKDVVPVKKAPKHGSPRTPQYRKVPISAFEGGRIVRVIENGDRHALIFELSYPIPDGGSDFPQRKLIFQCFSRYLVDEGGRTFEEATIQRVEIMEKDRFRMTIRLHTDHGVRETTCSTNVLEEIL